MTVAIACEWLKDVNKIVTRAFRLLCLLLLIFVVVPATRAQTDTATISGLVTDEGGGIVPNCEVVLQSVTRGTAMTVRTNDAGIYVFSSVQPGPYNLTIKRNGFKQVDFLGMIVNVQDHIEQNFRLQIGSVSESVTVTASGLNINTANATVSTVIDRQFVENLPLNGRSFNTLLQLTPGVVIAPADGNSPGQFSISGQRTDANSFTVDGVSANFGILPLITQYRSGTGTAPAFSALGGTSSLVSVDALQEFRIETSSFAPEFGRTTGGQIMLSTRSGTNDVHGGFFDYFRNTVMDANDWFANQAAIPRAAEHHNDFGGFLGGPIWRDRSFFFMSYEGARLDLPQTAVRRVPSGYAKSVAPTEVLPFLNAFPQPDDPTVIPGAYTATSTGSYANRASLDAGSVRVDHKINDRFYIFGRYNNAPSYTIIRGGTHSLSNVSTSSVNTQTGTVGVNMTLSSRISNTLHGNFSIQSAASTDSMDSFAGAVPLNASLLLGSLPSARNFAAFAAIGVSNYGIGPVGDNKSKQLNLVDGLSVTMGSHQLKVGGDYRAIWLDEKPSLNGISAIVFNFTKFISGPTAGQALVATGLSNPARVLNQAFSVFGQDAWRINNRLTVTYGLRWELSPAPSALGSTKLASWTNTSNPANIALAPNGTAPWKTTFGNFAPRLGVAYSLNQRGDFILRAGVGIFYDLGLGEAAILAGSFPNINVAFQPGVPLPITDSTPFLPGPASLQPPYPSSVNAFADNLKSPRSYQWSAALEKSLGGRQALSVTYVGQAGRDQLRQSAFFQPNSNFSGDLLLDGNDSRSNYHALQVQYRKPLSDRIQALLNYTWSHSLDSASDDVVIGLPNVVISNARDYASSDFDVRHSFSGAVTVLVPSAAKTGLLSFLTSGWSVDTVVAVRTGFPFNAVTRSVSLDPGGVASTRPDRDLAQPVYLYGAQCASVFQGLGGLAPGQSCPGGKGLNPNAFSIPSTVRQGTEGRNDIPGFGFTQVDLSIGRKFAITERWHVQFRADAFNVFNHPNFSNPDNSIDDGPVFGLSAQMLNQGLGGLNPLFQQGGPRSLQLSLRLSF